MSYTKLLKSSIPYEDWEEFKKYSKAYKSSSDYEQNRSDQLFEEIENPKYNLLISEDFILKKYPILSLGGDYNIMLGFIVKQINKNNEELGIKCAVYIGNENKKSSIYFISKDNNPIDSELIRSVISCSIEMYAQTFSHKKEMPKDLLDTTFKAAILANKLEKKELPQKKPMKI
jgi:outer membrane receptor for ferric coprogen and ferric-rhodotorulic acid